MRELLLTNGKVVLVDAEDYGLLSQFRWLDNTNGYAKRSNDKLLMHRLIMNCPKKMEVDHINHNKLDNRKENLRICTRSENHWNTKKHITNTSGFKGVNKVKKTGRWQARIRVYGKKLTLGTFTTPKEAFEVYKNAAISNFGQFANIQT